MAKNKQKINRHRIREEDMQAAMKPSKTTGLITSNKQVGQSVVFTVRNKSDSMVIVEELGDEEYPVIHDQEFENGTLPASERKEACAKLIYREYKNQYFVKYGQDGHLLNPMDVSLDNERTAHQRKIGAPMWKYKSINKKAFLLYLRFLRTKNTAWLLTAEREMS